ncbi:hypothetical protein LCGC14_2307160 [marine sediment metagenome]|uniref:Uncharacterized protein n=1 Tax=marine sediment metagenome TaxID=412755 RepID=A0A0F9EZ55_9ZZZZ|nr:hypothetical protein [Desulfobacterales bacterium]
MTPQAKQILKRSTAKAIKIVTIAKEKALILTPYDQKEMAHNLNNALSHLEVIRQLIEHQFVKGRYKK